MTILGLQDELSRAVGEILKDVITLDAAGEERHGVTVYRQQLPILSADEGSADDLFPYAIVETFYGATEDAESPWTVSTEIQVAVHDRAESNQGHQHIAVMIQRIIDRFCSDPLLADRYYASPEIEWAIADEDTYPYFFGYVRLMFSVPKTGRRMTVYD